MRIDLNCPAEVVSAEIIREGETWVRLILMNLTNRSIDSCEATVRFLDREGTEAGRTIHRARALRGRPHSTFPMMIPAEIPENAAGTAATLDKIWFEDRDVWRRNPSLETEYESNQLPPGNDLNALRYVAGNTAVGFPSQQAELWVCVCGRPNANGDSVCFRCRRQKETVFQQYNRNAVLRQVSQRERQLDLETRGAREETTLLQRQREEEYHQKQRRRRFRRRLLISLICAAGLCAACLFAGEPALRLLSADTALREDRPEDAAEILASLGDFPGAKDRQAEAVLRLARRDGLLAAEGTGSLSEERMTEIAALLREQGSGEDGRTADRVDLAHARKLLDAGSTESAEKLLQGLPETEERTQLLKECSFRRGETALENREFEEARKLFLELGDYPGAADLAKKALYETALARMEAGKYDEAVQAFSEIPDYEDSAALIPQCQYLKGYVLETRGETEEARQAYLAAGEYGDAAARAAGIRWNEAQTFLAAGDYASALPVFREMDGYQNAREHWISCATELARAAYKRKEYALAASLLEDLPEETREIRQIRTRGLYLGARAAAGNGELEEAIAMMEKVSSYSDAERNIREWRLELARQKIGAGLYDEAREILKPVENNHQAQQLLKEIEKKQAAEAEQAAEKEQPGETEKPADREETSEKETEKSTEAERTEEEKEPSKTEKSTEAETSAEDKPAEKEKP